MAGRDFSKRKVDAWFSGVGDGTSLDPSAESESQISEAVAAEGAIAIVGAGESSKSKKKQQKRHKATNPEKWPSKVATRKLHEVALGFFEQYSIPQLNTTYVSHGLQGVDAIKQKFHHMFWTTMSEDEWLKDRTKEYFNHWLESQVQTCIFNLAQVAEKIKGFQKSVVPKQQALNLLHKKVYWWHEAMRGLSSNNIRSAPWFQRSQNLAFGQQAVGGVVFLERGVVVVPLSGHNKQGGHRRVRKVCLQNSNHIPENMELAGKSAVRVDDLKKSREKLSIEALVCPCDHPGVIKFFVINDMTMECYSQWWNGGTLGVMFTLDEKTRDPDEIGGGGLPCNSTNNASHETTYGIQTEAHRTCVGVALHCGCSATMFNTAQRHHIGEHHASLSE